MSTTTAGFSVSMHTTLPFEQCLKFLRRLLPRDGLPIVAEVSFHREFERHVGLSWHNYTVLVVWSPLLAYQAVLTDRAAGLLMPFNVVVAEQGTSTTVSATNPALFGRIVGAVGFQVFTHELARKINQVFSGLPGREEHTAYASTLGEEKEAP